ncbi:MAG: FAD-dependent oxidoreductase [Pseudomonadota bacterium]
MARFDVTMRGAGIFGLSVAWSLVKRGARVQVIDPAGVGAGASGGIVGALAPHTPENWNEKKAFQFESLLMARSFWPEVEATGGKSSGYARSGRLQPLADDRAVDLARARAEGSAGLWEGQAEWRIVERAAGWDMASPSGLFVHDTLSAHLHPRRAVVSLAAALDAQGVNIVPDGEEEGAIVWATGVAGLADLSHWFDRPVGAPIKGQAALFQVDRRGAPQLFADTLHIIPHADGTVAVGSTSERDFEDPTACDGLLDDVVDRARAAVPDLADAPILARWAGLRPRAKSRAPLLGPWPDRPGHFIANGGFKIGFGMAPKVGEVMADLILDQHDTVPAAFSVDSCLT